MSHDDDDDDHDILSLSSPQAAVYTLKFHPAGDTLASAGFDKDICE